MNKFKNSGKITWQKGGSAKALVSTALPAKTKLLKCLYTLIEYIIFSEY